MFFFCSTDFEHAIFEQLCKTEYFKSCVIHRVFYNFEEFVLLGANIQNKICILILANTTARCVHESIVDLRQVQGVGGGRGSRGLQQLGVLE